VTWGGGGETMSLLKLQLLRGQLSSPFRHMIECGAVVE
jgi:hypothetical protein